MRRQKIFAFPQSALERRTSSHNGWWHWSIKTLHVFAAKTPRWRSASKHLARRANRSMPSRWYRTYLINNIISKRVFIVLITIDTLFLSPILPYKPHPILIPPHLGRFRQKDIMCRMAEVYFYTTLPLIARQLGGVPRSGEGVKICFILAFCLKKHHA